jgi:hypothetical protein
LKRGPFAGALSAVVTGGVMSLMVTVAGGDAANFTEAILALTLPLVAAGILFGWLTDTGRLPTFTRAILYWAAAFSVSRLAQQLMFGQTDLKDGPVGFVIYQAIVGMLFGFGYLLLYEQVLAAFRRVRGEAAPEAAADQADGGEGRG